MALVSRLASVIVLSAALAAPGMAQEPAADWNSVSSLYSLPAAVQQQLGVGGAASAISDRGGPFNESDVRQPGVPGTRFVEALAAGDTLLVVLERGGRAYHYEVREFIRVDGIWTEAAAHPAAWPAWVRRKYGPLQPFLKVSTK